MVSQWYGRVPITITLATAIGSLVLVAVGVVFGVGVWLAQKNTFDLLRGNAEQVVEADINQFQQHLRPAESMTRFLAEQIASGRIDPNDQDQLADMLTAGLAGVRQIEAVMYLDASLQAHIANRDRDAKSVEWEISDKSQDSNLGKILQSAQKGALWGSPVWSKFTQKTYLNRFHPVLRDGVFLGAVAAVTSIEGLSNYLDEHGLDSNGKSFILYGRDRVLAHWLLIDRYPDRSVDNPLPRLDGFGDPVLASIWQTGAREQLTPTQPGDVNSHFLRLFNDRYAFVYRSLDNFGPEPMIVGAYFQANDSIKEIQRMFAALIAGILALLLALIAAIILGHRIARPIVRFSHATGKIRDLDISRVEPLPGSLFRELNDQSNAFNSMLSALRWFELYVPKKLVERLIRRVDVDDTSSDHEVTIMFTDIAGFSTMSEGMSAPDVAAFVNHHFSIVAQCIESEDGTIDKFIGDAVMAFWGAPDLQADSAERACRAALAIGESIRADNEKRRARGEPPVGIRIGVHTGMATVGNIGAPGRLNYTIIGDTVNIGQRLEQLGKTVYPVDNEVSILISEATASKLGPGFDPVSTGSQKLKGRIGEIDVYKLECPLHTTG